MNTSFDDEAQRKALLNSLRGTVEADGDEPTVGPDDVPTGMRPTPSLVEQLRAMANGGSEQLCKQCEQRPREPRSPYCARCNEQPAREFTIRTTPPDTTPPEGPEV